MDKAALARLWQQLKQIFEPVLKDRAISLDNIKSRVWEEAERKYPRAWVHSVFTDSTGELCAILSQDGQLYKSVVFISEDDHVTLGDWMPVKQEFTPSQARTTLIRQADGRVRWFSRSATATLNRVGEIDSRQLFDSFVAHIEETGEYPIRQFFHKGSQFRTGQADFVARDGNVLITSGLYDKSELAQVEILARQNNSEFWGESIGYDPLESEIVRTTENVEIPVYTAGRLKEISTLPESEAANLFTATYQMEVKRMLTGKAKEAFQALFLQAGKSEDEAQRWLEENVDELNRAIEGQGMVTRSAELIKAIQDGDITRAQELIAEPEEEATEEQPSEEDPAAAEIVLDDDLVDTVVSRMTESVSFQSLSKQVNEVVAALETLNQNQQSVAETLAGIQNDANSRLEKLERAKEDQRREWLHDLPAQPNVTRVRYQPRADDSVPEKTAADIAEETLNGIGLTW